MADLPTTKPRKLRLLPTNDQALSALATFVAAHWTTETWLTLRFTTSAKFKALAATYQNAVASRQQAGSARPIHADEILTLDEQIDANLYRVKNRLVDKYDKKSALAHFPTVGITRYQRAYLLDRDRTKRAAALRMLVQGLKTEGIEDGPYGTAFWQPIAERYNELVGHLTDTSGSIAQAVGAKDSMRAEVETVLTSLTKALDANYPAKPEYKAQLRAWGFQREKNG